MTSKEMSSRLRIVLQNFDVLSKNGALRINGLSAIQTFGGCATIIQEIAETLESLDNIVCEENKE